MTDKVYFLDPECWNLNGIVYFDVKMNEFRPEHYILRIAFQDGLPRYSDALYNAMYKNSISMEEAQKLIDYFRTIVYAMLGGGVHLEYAEWNSMPGIEVTSIDYSFRVQ